MGEPWVKFTDKFIVGMIPDAGQRKRGFTAVCGHCGVRGSVPMQGGMTDAREDKIVTSKFEGRGWKIGNRKDQHRCPGCFSAIKAAAVRKSSEKKCDDLSFKIQSGMGAKIMKMQPPKIVEPAKEMTREDKRIVYDKLNDVYADEKIGYSGDWTDQKVSLDLGVPRSWVAAVRDEMFGPEGSNAKISATVRDAKEFLIEAKKVIEPAEKLMADLRLLLSKADKIEKTVIEIQRAVSG